VQVVVATDMGLPESVKLDETCRQQGVSFIRAETRGVFGSVFCDFGDAFTVVDTDGAPPAKRLSTRLPCGLLNICCALTPPARGLGFNPATRDMRPDKPHAAGRRIRVAPPRASSP